MFRCALHLCPRSPRNAVSICHDAVHTLDPRPPFWTPLLCPLDLLLLHNLLASTNSSERTRMDWAEKSSGSSGGFRTVLEMEIPRPGSRPTESKSGSRPQNPCSHKPFCGSDARGAHGRAGRRRCPSTWPLCLHTLEVWVLCSRLRGTHRADLPSSLLPEPPGGAGAPLVPNLCSQSPLEEPRSPGPWLGFCRSGTKVERGGRRRSQLAAGGLLTGPSSPTPKA